MPSLAARRGSYLSWVCLALGWMLGPESLVTLGRGVGQLGLVFVGLAVVWAAVHFTAANSGTARPGGTWDAALSLAGRSVVAGCGVTLILARAGYVFNEVFVYWFPNLGFSFVLLALLAGLNLAWPWAADRAQVLFVAVVVTGLMALTVFGLFNLAGLGPGAATRGQSPWAYLACCLVGLTQTTGWQEAASRAVMLGATLFIGYELAGFGPGGLAKNQGQGRTFRLAVLAAAAVFVLWGLVSYAYVPPARLAQSTVPYALTAWYVAGETGRIIIGLVLLGSCLAAANALLRGAAGAIAGLAENEKLPGWLARRAERRPWPILLLGSGVAAMLGLGYAGEPVTALYLRGGIGLWLLLYAVKSWTRTPRGPVGWSAAGSRLAGLLLAGAVAGLVWTDPDPVRLASFMAAAWGAALVLTGATRLINRPRPAGANNGVNPNRRMGV
ncbi:MAG: hypothetical protein KJ621_08150 [Proteobacteria bacterium]|nr:hypothetical protein [Pseudomonadota bacterium]MBU1742284.1 hypothetical protein [Pseudomonadota bacterium]